jgi:hypothetical protein
MQLRGILHRGVFPCIDDGNGRRMLPDPYSIDSLFCNGFSTRGTLEAMGRRVHSREKIPDQED